VTFRVEADGAGILRYQWFFNDAEIAGAIGANLSLTNVQLQHIGDYTVRVTDDIGSILSQPANLIVLVRPAITQQPVSQSAAPGETVVFSISAKGTLPMNYSWRRDGRVITNIMLHDNTCFLTVPNAQLTNGGGYRVGITNLAGVAFNGLSSNAVLIVLEDFDGDGLPDTWETANGLRIDDKSDAASDADGDNASNLHEYLAGTDANSQESHLRVKQISPVSAGTWRIEFIAVSNKTYGLEFRDGLQTGGWSRLAEFAAAPTNRLAEVIDTPAPALEGRRFYRVVTPCVP